MRFKDALAFAYQTPWSYNSTFEVYFAFNYEMLNSSSSAGSSYFESTNPKGVLAFDPIDNHRISLHVISISLPNITSAEITSTTGGKWARVNGMDSQFTFNMTFRDSNQLEFYRLFCTQYREQQYRYFDDYCFNVFVTKDSDYGDKYHNDDTNFEKFSAQSLPLISLKRCAVQSIGALQLSHESSNTIATFDVGFCANDIELYDGGRRQFYKHSKGVDDMSFSFD